MGTDIYALKEANDAKLDQKEVEQKALNAQEQMGRTIVKLATLKISVGLNMQLMIEEHDEALNAAKNNSTTETIEELEKLRQTLEDNKGYFMKIGQEQYMLLKQLKALQQSFNEVREKADKYAKATQVLQKDFEL